MLRLEKYCPRFPSLRSDGVKIDSLSVFSLLRSPADSSPLSLERCAGTLRGFAQGAGRDRQERAGRAAGPGGGCVPGGHDLAMAQEANLSSSREGGVCSGGLSALLLSGSYRRFCTVFPDQVSGAAWMM